MDDWDRDAVYGEIARLSRAVDQLRPSYCDPLSQPAPGAERLISSGDEADAALSISDADLRAAKIELAENHHIGFGQVEDMIRLTHQRSGLGFSTDEQVMVIQQVALTLGRGQSDVSDEQIVELSWYGADGADAALVALSTEEDGEDETVALAPTQESRAKRARAAGSDDAQSVIDRHPEFSHLFRPGRTSKGRHPSKSGQEVTSKTRAHASDLEDSPAAEDPASAVARYVKLREAEFGGEARHAGSHSSDSYPPKGPGQREREEHRARDSHKLDMGDLHPGPRER